MLLRLCIRKILGWNAPCIMTQHKSSIDRDWPTRILVFFWWARIPLAVSFLCIWGSWSNIESDFWDIPKTSISHKCCFNSKITANVYTLGKKLMYSWQTVLNLITHDKFAQSSSLADLFDHICEHENLTKHRFLHQQCRFAKIGKAAASFLAAMPVLWILFDETEATNLLIQFCRLYLSSELFITELEVLVYVDYHVTSHWWTV